MEWVLYSTTIHVQLGAGIKTSSGLKARLSIKSSRHHTEGLQTSEEGAKTSEARKKTMYDV